MLATVHSARSSKKTEPPNAESEPRIAHITRPNAVPAGAIPFASVYIQTFVEFVLVMYPVSNVCSTFVPVESRYCSRITPCELLVVVMPGVSR